MAMQLIHKQLGEIKFGEPKEIPISIENTENTPLYIQKVLLSCSSCTSVEIDKWVIMEREKITGKIIFTPGRIGEQTKQISIVCDVNKKQEEIVIKFTATVYE